MRRRILVVEDQSDNRQVMRDLLASAGYEVLAAAAGEQGLVLARREKPALILMEVKLPGLDGLEVTRRIKAAEALRDTPVIVVTSYAASDDNVRAKEAGCDAYVSKPVSPRRLLAKVSEFLPWTGSRESTLALSARPGGPASVARQTGIAYRRLWGFAGDEGGAVTRTGRSALLWSALAGGSPASALRCKHELPILDIEALGSAGCGTAVAGSKGER